jgi:hypothetical protein
VVDPSTRDSNIKASNPATGSGRVKMALKVAIGYASRVIVAVVFGRCYHGRWPGLAECGLADSNSFAQLSMLADQFKCLVKDMLWPTASLANQTFFDQMVRFKTIYLMVLSITFCISNGE